MSKEGLEQVIALYKSGLDVNTDLGLELEKSLKLNLSHFWQPVYRLYASLKGTRPSNKKQASKVFSYKSITLANRALGRVPEATFWIQQLEDLRLGLNRLTKISEDIQLLKNLKKLDLSHNPLMSIPQGLTALSQLDMLSLEATKTSSLPDFFQELKQITRLNLSQNKFKAIPEWIVELKNLEVLDLSRNQLEGNTLKYLLELPKLQFLSISNNNFSNPEKRQWAYSFSHIKHFENDYVIFKR